MKSYNAFKRAVQIQATTNKSDALNPNNLPVVRQGPNSQIVLGADGKLYKQILPGNQTTDPNQLKDFPNYILIDNAAASSSGAGNGNASRSISGSTVIQSTTSSSTSSGSDTVTYPIVDVNELNADVYTFLDLLSNELGSRISFFLDQSAFDSVIQARDLVGTDQIKELDSITSNIIIGMDKFKLFLYKMGKKIAPPGINPYLNSDLKIKSTPIHTQQTQPAQHTQSRSCGNSSCQCGCEPAPCHPAPPVQNAPCPKKCDNNCPSNLFPDDINTYLNCLDSLINDAMKSPVVIDFNLQVFQTIIQNSYVTKFADYVISPVYDSIKPPPKFNMLPIILLLIKIDTLFFSILYRLNLHNAFKSPITGAYYGKPRVVTNDMGNCVVNNIVTNQDIFNSTVLFEDLLNTIIKLITFIPPDSLLAIMDQYFSITSVNPQANTTVPNTNIIIDASALNVPGYTDGSTDNIPCFMYGYLLSFCDVARQILTPGNLPFPSDNTDPTVIFNPAYEPSSVANYAINCVYGMLSVNQLMEEFMKSNAFVAVMSLLFPSGISGTPNSRDIRDISGNQSILEVNRDSTNRNDFLNMLMTAIFGSEKFAMNLLVPASTIPGYTGDHTTIERIQINTAQLYAIHNKIASISRILFGSNAPILKPCDFQYMYDPTFHCGVMPSTTMPPNMKAPRRAPYPIHEPATDEIPDADSVLDPEDGERGPIYVDDPTVAFLLENIPQSVLTENGRVIGPMKNYIIAYAKYILTQYNILAMSKTTLAPTVQVSARNIFEFVTKNSRR